MSDTDPIEACKPRFSHLRQLLKFGHREASGKAFGFFFLFSLEYPQGVDSSFARSNGTTDDTFRISPLYRTPFSNYVSQPKLSDIIVLYGIPGSCSSATLDFDQM